MQTGFAMLEAGTVRIKNTKNSECQGQCQTSTALQDVAAAVAVGSPLTPAPSRGPTCSPAQERDRRMRVDGRVVERGLRIRTGAVRRQRVHRYAAAAGPVGPCCAGPKRPLCCIT